MFPLPTDDIDYRTFAADVTLRPGQATSCLSMDSSAFIIDDTLLEFTEYFEVIASQPDIDREQEVSVQPFSTATIFIIDNESKQYSTVTCSRASHPCMECQARCR